MGVDMQRLRGSRLSGVATSARSSALSLLRGFRTALDKHCRENTDAEKLMNYVEAGSGLPETTSGAE
jgi:hypothetical protein